MAAHPPWACRLIICPEQGTLSNAMHSLTNQVAKTRYNRDYSSTLEACAAPLDLLVTQLLPFLCNHCLRGTSAVMWHLYVSASQHFRTLSIL